MKILPFLALFALFALPVSAQLAPESKSRLVVLTDVGADPDDTMSLVRLFLYSNEIDIEGLVATTSVWKRTSVSPELIDRVIDAYGMVQPNLLLHAAGYPTAEETAREKNLRPTPLRDGGSRRGLRQRGFGLDRPVPQKGRFAPALGLGMGRREHAGAGALPDGKDAAPRGAGPPRREAARLHHLRSDDSGYWIRKNFPNLFYIVSPGDDYGSATWSAINTVAEGFDNSVIDNAWIAANLQQGHGPLGAVYPDVAYGMEGDTPAWLSLVPNGLNCPEHPDYGGWGGRYELYKPDLSPDAKGVSGILHSPKPADLDERIRRILSVAPLRIRPGRRRPRLLSPATR
jgi:hypothetical protein